MNIRKKISALKAVTKARLLGISTPLSVTMSIVGTCNYRCAYCEIWKKGKKPMATEKILRLIDELAKMGTQRIGLTQDEPLLHDDIGKVIDCCKEKDIFVTMGTNGSLIEERINEIKNLDVLILSLDGPPEIHDKHRIPGAHANVIRAIKVAHEHGIAVWINTVLTKFNLGHMEYIFKKAVEFNFKASFQLLYHSLQVAGNTENMLPPPEDYRMTIKRLIAAKKQGAPIINSYSLLDHLYNWPNYKNPFFDPSGGHRKKIKCYGGRLFLNIESNGDTFPCSQLIGNPLNCLEGNLKEAIQRAALNCCPYCCLGADYIEYNLLFSMNPESIWNARKIR